MSPELELFQNTAREAGELLMKMYNDGKPLGIAYKSEQNNTPVTRIDCEVNNLIAAQLSALKYPVIGEESKPKHFYSPSGEAVYFDPLDSTNSLINGKPEQCAVMIGKVQEVEGIYRPTIGVIFAPFQDILYFAEKGEGAYYEEKGKSKRLLINDMVRNLRKSIAVSSNTSKNPPDQEYVKSFGVKEIVRTGSLGLRLMKIARNKGHFHIHAYETLSYWDACAPQIILEEAGGRCSDIAGKDVQYTPGREIQGLIASTRSLHPIIVDRLKVKAF